MLPQDPSQGHQHIAQRRLGLVRVPRQRGRQQRGLLHLIPCIPRLDQGHQDHRQWRLSTHGPAAPPLVGLDHILFGPLNRLLHTTAVLISLHDLGGLHIGFAAEQNLLVLASSRIAYDHQTDVFGQGLDYLPAGILTIGYDSPTHLRQGLGCLLGHSSPQWPGPTPDDAAHGRIDQGCAGRRHSIGRLIEDGLDGPDTLP